MKTTVNSEKNTGLGFQRPGFYAQLYDSFIQNIYINYPLCSQP